MFFENYVLNKEEEILGDILKGRYPSIRESKSGIILQLINVIITYYGFGLDEATLVQTVSHFGITNFLGGKYREILHGNADNQLLEKTHEFNGWGGSQQLAENA